MMRAKKHNRIRLFIQLAAAALLNGYAAGFAGGRVFTGVSKAFCVPVLNCYACPGALGSCPIGALQTVLGSTRHRFPFYVLGSLMVFGIALGRLWCGFICPFGLIQDLLYKIPTRKLTVPRQIDGPLRYVKYAVLAFLIVLLPLLATDQFGIGKPYFCQYLCPAGMLEGAAPLMLANRYLRSLAGALFTWKMAVLLAVLISAVLIPRSFCRYLCPLGAFYGLFNRFSLYQMHLDGTRCTGCGTCERICPMAVRIPTAQSGKPAQAAPAQSTAPAPSCAITSPECIRCGKCAGACPQGAIGHRRTSCAAPANPVK